jgi:succinate dehydrogenase flavin-adding protein (antitoxin of CptAB toxin-antitoxin module)
MFNEINNKVIEILEIDSLPLEEQKEAMERLGSLIFKEVLFQALNKLNEQEKEEFNKMLNEDKDPEILYSYLSEKVPSLSGIVIEEAQKLRESRDEILND